MVGQGWGRHRVLSYTSGRVAGPTSREFPADGREECAQTFHERRDEEALAILDEEACGDKRCGDKEIDRDGAGRRGEGLVLEPGMTFTIEPMINAGRRHTRLNQKDGWTVTTRDGRLSAQWEHTLAVTDDGCEVLTRRSEETFA